MEELKMIIELVGKVTDDAFWVLVMYFSKSILTMIILFIGWLCIIVYGIKPILTKFIGHTKDAENLKLINRMLENPVRDFDSWYQPDMIDLLNRLKSELKPK